MLISRGCSVTPLNYKSVYQYTNLLYEVKHQMMLVKNSLYQGYSEMKRKNKSEKSQTKISGCFRRT